MSTLSLQTLRYELADGIGVVTFDEQGSPVNTMCAAWQADMATLAERVRADRAQAGLTHGLILTSAKTTFFAGADLRSLMNAPRLDPAETLSPGQAAALDRVIREHPDLVDDAFVRAGLARWLAN